MALTRLFKEFLSSKKAEGFVVMGVHHNYTNYSQFSYRGPFIHFLHSKRDLSFTQIHLNYSNKPWVKDGLMAIFYRLAWGSNVSYIGELSSFKIALLLVLAAIGGMRVPALIHFLFNSGTSTQSGFGIPMATDMAFALGVLALAGSKFLCKIPLFSTIEV